MSLLSHKPKPIAPKSCNDRDRDEQKGRSWSMHLIGVIFNCADRCRIVLIINVLIINKDCN